MLLIIMPLHAVGEIIAHAQLDAEHQITDRNLHPQYGIKRQRVTRRSVFVSEAELRRLERKIAAKEEV